MEITDDPGSRHVYPRNSPYMASLWIDGLVRLTLCIDR